MLIIRISAGQISPLKVAFYGGLAGEALWLGSYPFDVVKSKMQTDGFGAEKRYLNMVCPWASASNEARLHSLLCNCGAGAEG